MAPTTSPTPVDPPTCGNMECLGKCEHTNFGDDSCRELQECQLGSDGKCWEIVWAIEEEDKNIPCDEDSGLCFCPAGTVYCSGEPAAEGTDSDAMYATGSNDEEDDGMMTPCTDPKPIWGNCHQSHCCEAGLVCYNQHQWYSQCRRPGECPSGWTCEMLGDMWYAPTAKSASSLAVGQAQAQTTDSEGALSSLVIGLSAGAGGLLLVVVGAAVVLLRRGPTVDIMTEVATPEGLKSELAFPGSDTEFDVSGTHRCQESAASQV